MKKVWIAQLKCPNTHCVIATAAEIEDKDADALEDLLWATFNHMVSSKMVNYECGICKSTSLHAHVARTTFETMEEARPTLEESERQQLESAAFLRQSKN